MHKGISIHAPARGATQQEQNKAQGNYISIHAPARGATIYQIVQSISNPISIHAPARGATSMLPTIISTGIFQSTLPRGERPVMSQAM